jgi:hypothetical protein
MSSVERDPERGRATAAKLKALGVKGILIKAAEQGYITQLACKMPECFCPEELGGACYFEPVTAELSDWMPTHEHFPLSKREGGKVAVDNAILAHRLCNRIDYSISVGRSHASDLKRIKTAREDAIRHSNDGPNALRRPAELEGALPGDALWDHMGRQWTISDVGETGMRLLDEQGEESSYTWHGLLTLGVQREAR